LKQEIPRLMPLLPLNPAPVEKSARYVRGVFHSAHIGSELQAAILPGMDAPEIFPAFVADFIESCHEFRTLEDHAGRYGATNLLNRAQFDALLHWVPQLVEMGALICEHGLLDGIAAEEPAGDDAPPVACLGIPTGGNTAMLMRCVESFVENARRHGRDVEFLVADNSRDPAVAAESRRRLAELARRSGARISLCDNARRAAFARLLAEKSGVDPALVRFALDDVHGAGFAAGVNRNVILLHNVGRIFAGVDDDVVCRIAAPPETVPGPRFYTDGRVIRRRFFTSREAALDSAQFVDADFFALHGEWLGRPLASCVRAAGGACGFESIREGTLWRLAMGGGGIISTFCSFLPDPGIPTSTYHLYCQGRSLEHLTSSEEFYRAVMRERSFHLWSPCVLIGDGELSPGIAWGFDQRGLLPPCFPVFHAEDFSYGAVLSRCCPQGFTAWLPHGVLHDPGPGKPLLHLDDFTAENRVVIPEFAHLLRHLVLRAPLPEACRDRADRMLMLGRHLRLIGSLPGGAFREFLQTETLDHEGARLSFLENRLCTETDMPDFWRDDVQRLIDHTRDALTHDDFDIPWDLKPVGPPEKIRALMQTLIRQHGELLENWPRIHAAALGLAADGTRIGEPVGE
jgi:hypothetical protein